MACGGQVGGGIRHPAAEGAHYEFRVRAPHQPGRLPACADPTCALIAPASSFPAARAGPRCRDGSARDLRIGLATSSHAIYHRSMQGEQEFQKLYIAIAAGRDDHVLQRQNELCARLGLVPRAELHITLAYLGPVEASRYDRLCTLLQRPLAINLEATLHIDGVGGIARASDGNTERSLAALMDPSRWRVAWWALRATDALSSLREAVLDGVQQAGIELPPSAFWPHVTVGSAVPSSEPDSKWDMHNITKGADLPELDHPGSVSVDAVHLTDASIHPTSIVRIPLGTL